MDYNLIVDKNLVIKVDWDTSSSSPETQQALAESATVEQIFVGLREAVAVWYNVTHDKTCFGGDADEKEEEKKVVPTENFAGHGTCTTNFSGLTASWGLVCCNDNIRMVNCQARGVGRDMFWPPTLPRNWSYDWLVNRAGSKKCHS